MAQSPKRAFWTGCVLVVGVLSLANSSSATTIGYQLTISGDASMGVRETYSLINSSTAAAKITSFAITDGSGSHHFDCATALNASGASAVLVTPDSNCFGGSTSSTVEFSFSGFDPLDSLTWEADLDPNSGPNDWRQVLFPNGLVTVGFDVDGQSQSLTLTLDPASPLASTLHTFNQSATAIPEPTSFVLLGFGLVIGSRGFHSRN